MEMIRPHIEVDRACSVDFGPTRSILCETACFPKRQQVRKGRPKLWGKVYLLPMKES